MSKKLEESYKSMMAEEVPDLWDRIEQNLPEKTPNTTAKPEGQVIEFKSIKRAPEGSIRKIDKKHRLAKLSGLAVACLALLVVIPVVINTKKADEDGGRQRRRNDAKVAAADAENAIDLSQEASEAAMLDASESATLGYGGKDNNGTTTYSETPTYFETEGNGATNQEDMVEGFPIEDEDNASKNKSASISSSGETVTVIFNIVESNFDEEGEISYSAVITDALGSSGITNGQNIVIYSNGGAQDNLEAGSSYTFTLKYVETLDDGRAAYCFN